MAKGLADQFIAALPSVEEIERMLDGNCPHGMAVVLCRVCAVDRLFVATMGNLGMPADEAEAAAAQIGTERRNPRCSREGCAKPSDFAVRFNLIISGAGVADGEYGGEIEGGACAEHCELFTRGAAGHGARDIAAKLCEQLGVELPAAAVCKMTCTATPIVKEAC